MIEVYTTLTCDDCKQRSCVSGLCPRMAYDSGVKKILGLNISRGHNWNRVVDSWRVSSLLVRECILPRQPFSFLWVKVCIQRDGVPSNRITSAKHHHFGRVHDLAYHCCALAETFWIIRKVVRLCIVRSYSRRVSSRRGNSGYNSTPG